MTSRPGGASDEASGDGAITTRRTPAAAAASRRWPVPATARMVPVSASSPRKPVSGGRARPALAEASAAAIARSVPGSSRRRPPVEAPKISARPSREPRARPGLALEGKDRVDGVLERARTGEVAALRDVADQEHGDPTVLRQRDQGVGAGPHLPDAAGERVRSRIAEGVDRVHDEDVRA